MDRLIPFRRFVLVIILLSLSLFAQAQITPTGGIVYVTPTGAGSQNGSSWLNATSNLQAAINASNVEKVFVASGNYPSSSVNGFKMKNGVEIYGGFNPGSGITDLTHDRIMPNPANTAQGSVLNGQNLWPVIMNNFTSGTRLDTTAILDGFTLANGLNISGAGVHNEFASPKLRNIVIRNCAATVSGAGIYNASSSPIISNAVICNNKVENFGADILGAGIFNTSTSSPVLINVTLTGNRLITSVLNTMRGGGIYSEGNSTLTIRNSIIWNNQKNIDPTIPGADIEIFNTTLSLKNSITQSYATTIADSNKVNVSPQFVSPLDGNFTLGGASPAINGGSNSHYPTWWAGKDLAGSERFSGAAIDMGAFEFSILPGTGGIVYVKPTVSGTGRGNNWANATNILQDAIDAPGTQKVFVAIGNHNTPSANGFKMKNGVEIYGGFDPDNGISDLSHNRMLPNYGASEGSVLNGQNTGRVIYNNYTSGNLLSNTALLDGFTIMNGNNSDNGGGIYNTYASPVFNNLVVKNNTAVNNGGGVYNYNANGLFTNCIIRNNTLSGGIGRGGGVHNWESSVRFTNVIIADNTANAAGSNASGGGVYNNGTTAYPVFTNVTIAANKVTGQFPYAAAMYNNGSHPEMYNSIIWGNQNLGNVIIGYEDIYNNGVATLTLKNSITQQFTTNNPADNNKVGTNPQFVDMAAGNYTLMAASPAINAGNNAYYTGLNASTTDVAGRARVYKYNENGIIDMGAYEFPPVLVPGSNGIIYVKTTATGRGNGDSWTNATSDLHNAIQTNGVQKVFVAAGTYTTGINSFVMKNGVEIYGGFDPGNGITDLTHNRIMPNPANTQGSVLDAENARPVIWNVFASGTALNNTAVLDGFTLTKGSFATGAGMRNIYASPTLKNVVIRNNAATASGAGIYNENSSPLLTNVIISSNSISNAGTGAAVSGAGICNINSSAPVLTNLTITGNTLYAPAGTMKGAGVYSNNSSPLIYNSIIWNNQKLSNPATPGADIEKEGSGALTLKNSIIQTYNTGSPADNNKVGIDPLFVSTGTYTLMGASPAINSGNNSYFTGHTTSKDLAGNPRLSGAVIDMGAYEFPIAMSADANGIIYVKTQADGDRSGRDWANATDDLHNSIHLNGVHKVFVAIGNYPVGENSFIMKNGVEIYGGFDPGNGITDLTHNRIIPNPANTQGSVLNGQNARPVIWNVFASGTEMNTSAVLDAFTVTGGSFGDGAGIRNIYASPTLRNLVIRENNATSFGGGMLNSNSNPRISNTVICNNTVINSTLPVYGGGICNNNNAMPEFINTTITGNRLSSGTAMFGAGCYNASGAVPKIYNSIIWNNQKGTDPNLSGADIQNSGTTPLLKNSITQGYTTGNPADNNQINANPLFTNAAAGNFTLQNNTSPAVNAGENTLFTGLNGHTKDLAGNPRVYNSANGGIIDIGAYESSFSSPLAPDANNIIYVKPGTSGTGSGNSWANATADLPNAINTAGVQKVYVATGNYNADGNGFVMKNGVEIYGGFNPVNNITDWDTRTLPNKGMGDGSVLNGQNIRRVVYNVFTSGTALNNTAVLDGFSIMNGKTTGSGAGIYNYYASPTLRNLVVQNNEAGTAGGGIYNNLSSAISLSNSIIKDNTAQYGGGVYNNSSASVFTNVSITGNEATLATTGAGGGGIFNENAALALTNVLIANNSTNFQGGGFRNLSGNPVLTNVTIAGNAAPNNTASTAMDIAAGTLQINNSIIYGTVAGSYTPQYSLIEANAGGSDGNLDGTAITAAQVFTDAANHIYTLLNNAPVIDAGSNALYAGLNSSTRDIAGNPRRSGTTIDMGAYEFPIVLSPDANKIIYVKPIATGYKNGSSWADATSDLHNAIHTGDVEKVFVATGNYPVGDSSFIMRNGVEIYGGFDPANGITDLSHSRILPNYGVSDGSVLDGENVRPVIWNTFTLAAVLNTSAVLDGFTVMDGLGYDEGGGIRNVYASPTLRNLVIKNNALSSTGSTRGGGVFNRDFSSPVLTNIIIKGNTGRLGGGFASLANCEPILTNVLVAGNIGTDASQYGGVYEQGKATYTNVTIAGNTGKQFFVSNTNTQLNNVIVLGENSSSLIPITNIHNSLITGQANTANGNLNPSTINANKLFTDPANGDYTLRPGAPAIDAGSNVLFNGLNAATKDVAGNARVFDFANNGVIDIGAYESPNPGLTHDVNNIIYVKQAYSGNGSGRDWANATDNLHDAIHVAGVQKVFVAAGNYPVGEHSYIMKNNVEIYGGFDPDNGITDLSHNRILPNHGASEGSVLDGQNARPVIWNDNNGLTNSAILDGFTIKNGNNTNYGGGIYNNYASPLYRNLVVKNNRANAGGGIYSNWSSPVITNVVLLGNYAYSASANGGGGMFSTQSNPVLTNVAIINNEVNGMGGGYLNDGGNPVFNNVSVAGNEGDAVVGAGITLNNSIVYKTDAVHNAIAAPSYTAYNSLIEGSSNTSNGNINATGITAGNIFTNPAAGNYTLKNGSPAVGRGHNALFTGLDENTKDLAGNPRVYNLAMGGVIDLGAYESTFMGAVIPDDNGVVYVREGYAGNGKSWATATGNLQEAIDAANVNEVYAAVGNYNVSPTNSFVMKNNVAIYGGFDPDNGIEDLSHYRILPTETVAGSVLNGLNSKNVIWNVAAFSSPMDNSAVLDGFTVTNGLAASNNPGAGIHNDYYASPTMRNLVVKGNHSAGSGGGISNRFGSNPVLTNIVVTGNTTVYNGGGLYNYTSHPVLTNVSITNNTVTLTTAAGTVSGGGIYNASSNPVITNALIAGNMVTHTGVAGTALGGGVYNTGNAVPVFTNVTIADNKVSATTTSGGGIYDNSTASGLSLYNSIIWGNQKGGSTTVSGADIENTGIITLKNSITQGYTTGNISDSNKVNTDPLFTDPANSDYTLTVQSPAINTGSNALYAGLNAGTKDIAGNMRVYNFTGGGNIDMGAYESFYDSPITHDGNGIVYVREGYSGTGSSWTNATGDLQAAINGLNVQKVFVATGNYYVPFLSEGFVMKNGVEIYGGFDPGNNINNLNDERILPNHGIYEGSVLNGNNQSRVIDNKFTSSTALYASAVLDGFTVKNGSMGEGAGAGGINNVYASPTLRNLVIKENIAYAGNGGGILNNHNSSPVISNVIITENEAENGSGIYNDNGSAPVLTNVLLTGNMSDDDYQINDRSGSIYNNVTLIGNIYAAVNTSWNNAIVFGDFDMPLGISYAAQYSLIQGNTDLTNGNLSAATLSPADIFADPANGNYKLKPGSVAINAGSNALFAGLNADTKDLAGNPRLLNGAIDMGAFEFDPNAPLPIKLLSFIVQKQGTTALLQWITATEQNSKGFEVQRSTDGSQWQPLTFVASKAVNGNSTQELHYSYTDDTPVQGKNYYRLKQSEDGGTFEYSPVRMVAFDGARAINMYPNPAHEQVAITGLAGGETIIIYDAAGKMLMRREGNSIIELISVSGLSQGVYHLQVASAGGALIFTGKLVKAD